MTRLVAGVDAGGTSTRCLVTDEAGDPVARSAGPGANPNSSPDAAAALAGVLRSAVGDRSLSVLVVGMAGAGPAGRAAAHRVVQAATADLDVRRVIIRTDVEIAFAAGSDQPDGTVLVAGTGAVAARVEDFAVVRQVDGLGYLLGDAGSAVWLGLQACRAVVAAAEGRAPATALAGPLRQRLGSVPAGLDDAQAVVAAVYAHPPAWIGTLAPLVEQWAPSDPVAADLLARGVAELVATARSARVGTSADAPLVVGGSLAAGDGPLGRAIRAGLTAALGIPPVLAGDGAAGAAALARRALS